MDNIPLVLNKNISQNDNKDNLQNVILTNKSIEKMVKNDQNTIKNTIKNNSMEKMVNPGQNTIKNNSFYQIENTLFRKTIVEDILRPATIRDIKDSVKGRFRCRKFGDVLIGLVYTTLIISSVFSFGTSTFGYSIFSYIAGTANLLTALLLKMSSNAYNESERRERRTNKILKELKIEGFPNIINNNEDNRLI
jgi:hypothetical protein